MFVLYYTNVLHSYIQIIFSQLEFEHLFLTVFNLRLLCLFHVDFILCRMLLSKLNFD